MSPRSVRQQYGHKAADAVATVIAVCETLSEFAKEGQEAFLSDTKSQWAAGMGLIRIGEMVNRFPAELVRDYPDQPWRQIIDLRNLAAHQYDDLEPSRVWRTISRDVPALRDYLHATLGHR